MTTTGARHVWLVMRREWSQRISSTAFRVSTRVAGAIIVAIIAIPQILGGDPSASRTVGVVGEASPAFASAVVAAGDQVGLRVETRSFSDQPAGETALRSGQIDVLVVGQRALVWKSEPDEVLGSAIQAAIQGVAQAEAIRALGLTPSQLASLRPVDVTSSSLEAVSAERSARLDLAMIGLVLLLLAISFYGGFVLIGVIEEKSSRVIEVLLSRLRPSELLTGKIAGIGLVGLVQVAIVAVAALIALAASQNATLPTTTGSTIGWLVLWFLLGYGFYSVLFGAAGSLVSRQEDAQSMTFPITGVLIVAYILAMQAAQAPDSTAALIGSFVPPTAPMVMLVRIAYGGVPWWQIGVSIAVMLVTIAALLRLAGRVYTGAALRLGSRIKVADAWRGAASSV
jgi:ABC-2 type transport system permease protein